MVYHWLELHESFRKKYERARIWQAESLGDEALEVMRNGKAEDAPANRLRLDSIRWYAAVVAPRKFGAQATVKHEGSVDVNVALRSQSEDALREQIAAMAARIGVAGVTDVVDETETPEAEGDDE